MNRETFPIPSSEYPDKSSEIKIQPLPDIIHPRTKKIFRREIRFDDHDRPLGLYIFNDAGVLVTFKNTTMLEHPDWDDMTSEMLMDLENLEKQS